ncbi:uncharacterized protein isoform X2 [Rhodnius prolixus]|uniref:Uncharacterized protein n=1 Tax=Rhodnius prolixus TaxID=13249 RepID=A0A4P6D7S3_RHOPR
MAEGSPPAKKMKMTERQPELTIGSDPYTVSLPWTSESYYSQINIPLPSSEELSSLRKLSDSEISIMMGLPDGPETPRPIHILSVCRENGVLKFKVLWSSESKHVGIHEASDPLFKVKFPQLVINYFESLISWAISPATSETSTSTDDSSDSSSSSDEC